MRRRRHRVRLILWPLLTGVIILFGASGFFLLKGQRRLLDLVNHRTDTATEVYTAWLSLTPKAEVTDKYIEAWLEALGYEKSAKLERPGQMTRRPDAIDLWSRGFEYPDRTVAAQQIRLRFSSGRLQRIESLQDEQELPEWRIEPKRLARWSTSLGATQPKVVIQDLPGYVPRAVIAIEDRRFFDHGAIDVRGLLRAVWVDVREGQLRQGGSTISQQLSRSIFLDIRRTWRRKLLESALAFYLEARYSKDQLLEMYLNQVYWGQEGAESLLGLESASRSYFGKAAKELSLSEAALLAGLLQSPNHYSPRADLQIAKQRRDLVLSLMHEQGMISKRELQLASSEAVKVVQTKARLGAAPYFVASLQDELIQKYSLPVVMNQGWHIFTTLNPVLQNLAVNAVKPPVGQSALVAIEPQSGAVRAWVGGTDYGKSSYDRVINAHRQPGSAFKPFVVLAALDTHQATASTMLEDKPFTLKSPSGVWKPQNYDHIYRNRVSVRDAIIFSANIPMVHLAMTTGLETVVHYARRLGIQSDLRAVPSLALGTSEVTPLELTAAYATLANEGRYEPPYYIETILDAEENVVLSHTRNSEQVVSAASAFLVTRMLQGVIEEGTAKQAKTLGLTFTAAGKTGTSENYQDAWFVGYVPTLTCGVWVGYDKPRPLGHAAAGIALPIWVRFMESALVLEPEIKWQEPDGIVWKTIDPETGELARSGCPTRKKEAYLETAAPEKDCSAHPGGLRGFFYRLRRK